MIIESLEIKNFLSHENTRIDFENGINIITGKNGAGKTSILDAIKFALFAESRNNEKNNELVKKGKKFFEIFLKFNISGDVYEIYRHFGIKNSKNVERLAYVKKNSVMVAETYEGVNAEVARILNVSKDVFKNSVFVEQGQMDSLITGTPKERKTILSDIIGLTSLSKMAERLHDIIGRLRNESMLLEASNGIAIQAEKEIEKLNEDLAEYKKQLSAATDEEKVHEENLKLLMGRVEERDKIKNGIAQENSIKSRYNDEIYSKNIEINSTSIEIGKLKEKLKRLAEIESNIYYSNREILSEYFNRKKRFDDLVEQKAEIDKEIDKYKNTAEDIAKLKELHETYQNNVALKDRNASELNGLIDFYNNYNRLETQLESVKVQLDAGNKFIKDTLTSSGLNIDELRNARAERENANREIISKKSEVSALKSRVIQLNQAAKEYRENSETLKGKNKCPLCGTELTQEHMNEVLEEYKALDKKTLSEITSIGIDKGRLDGEIKALQDKYDKLSSSQIDRAIAYMEELGLVKEQKEKIENAMEKSKVGHDRYITIFEENKALENKINGLRDSEIKYNRVEGIINSIDIKDLQKRSDKLATEIKSESSGIENIEKNVGMKPDYTEFKNMESFGKEIAGLMEDNNRLLVLNNKLDSLKSEIEDRKKSIEAIEKNVENLVIEMSKFDQVDEQLKYENAEFEKFHSLEIQARTMIESTVKRIDDSNKKLESLRDDITKFNKLKNAMSKLEKIREAFDYNGIQGMIRKDGSVSITSLTRKYLQSFNLDFDDISVDENFNITVTQNSMEQSLESLSGGEKTALAIALRIAVANYVLDRISTMIMDEPTNFLDEDRRNNLKDIIQYSLKGENIIPQMIMITHHSELTSVADVSFEIVKKDGTSTVITS
ncbi:MAG: AAA family ATPase [Ferroplasma sp.]